MKTYVQQIMLGTVTGNEKSARETLTRIADAGYDGLELNRFMVHPSSWMVRAMTKMAGMPTGNGGKLDWRALVKESGLSVASLHCDLGSLEREADPVVEEALGFGTDRIVITGMYRFDYTDIDNVRNLARRLNDVGEKLRSKGVSLLYHNHNIELLKVGENMTAYDVLIDQTEPELVGYEFDSFWFTDGGADAKAWMRRLGSRMKMWHVTDRGARQSGPSMTPILKSTSVELGTGSMDLEGLLLIARENGVEDVVLESHRDWIDKDPVKSLELSSSWLNKRK